MAVPLPFAYYKLDGTPNDATGTYNGTETGTVTYSSSIFKIIQSFNKTDASTANYISVADANPFDLNYDTWTVNLWCRFASLTGEQGMVAKYQAATNGTWYIFKYPTGFGQDHRISFSKNNVEEIITTSAASLDTWFMYTIVSESSTTKKAYFNGSLETTDTSFSNPVGSTAATRFGGRGPDDANTMNGYLDEIGFWDTALDSGQISELYNGGNALAYPFTSGPTGVKTFDGVTQSSGISTYLGASVATTKSVNGIT